MAATKTGRHIRAVPRCSARSVCGDADEAMRAPASVRGTAKHESQRCPSISNTWSTVVVPHGSISVFCVHRLTASVLDSFLCCGATVTRRTPSRQVAGNSSHAEVISKPGRTDQDGARRRTLWFICGLNFLACLEAVQPDCYERPAMWSAR